MDVSIYTVALQRKAKHPTVEHLLRLNRVVKWLRRKPIRMLFSNLYTHAEDNKLRTTIITDSAFRKEDQAGLAMRGYVIAFSPLDNGSPGGPMHFLDWGAKKQKRVCRSTYAAEAHSLIDGFELGKVITVAATELIIPNLRPGTIVRLEEQGKLCWPIEVIIDAKSVFDSLACSEVTPPTETALLFILLVLKEGLQSHTIRTMWWCDTRDMLADGLNKGVISRVGLNAASVKGQWVLAHPPVPFRESRHRPVIREEDHGDRDALWTTCLWSTACISQSQATQLLRQFDLHGDLEARGQELERLSMVATYVSSPVQEIEIY